MQKQNRQGWSLLSLIGGALFTLAPLNATEPATQTWIVTFAAPPTASQVEALTGLATQVHAYQHLPAAVAVVPFGSAGLLANLPGVQGVYPNRTLQKALAQSVSAIRADGVWADGYDGAGIGIAIVDTGVVGTHPDLCAAAEFCNGTGIKTVQNVKFLGNQTYLDPVVVLENQINTDTSSGHGSHVAGIAAGNQLFGGSMSGAAPGAKIVSVRACLFIAGCTSTALIEGMIYVAKQSNVDVINMSIGRLGPDNDGYGVQEAIIDRLTVQNNTVFIIAAANDGPGRQTVGSPSVARFGISVAATATRKMLLIRSACRSWAGSRRACRATPSSIAAIPSTFPATSSPRASISRWR